VLKQASLYTSRFWISGKVVGGRQVAAEWIVVGNITAPQGVRGEVRLYPGTDFPERLLEMRTCHLRLRSGEITSYQVRRVRPHKTFFLLKLAGIDDRDCAETLRDAAVVIPKTAVMPLPEGRYYTFELIGMQVFTNTGEEVGTVHDVLFAPANDVYVVRRPGRADVLVPAVKHIVTSIDVSRRTMVITPPAGLLDEEGDSPDED
jgi:16S rRNA processing protein RimM